MTLRETLRKAHDALTAEKVDHALIGGMALASLGINRATADVDFLIDGNDRLAARSALEKVGFTVSHESLEVLQFKGAGQVDLLLANRPMSKKMLSTAVLIASLGIKCLHAEDLIGLKIQAYINNPKREYQDKADIRSLIEKNPNLDWEKVKTYADLFGQWVEIQTIRSKV